MANADNVQESCAFAGCKGGAPRNDQAKALLNLYLDSMQNAQILFRIYGEETLCLKPLMDEMFVHEDHYWQVQLTHGNCPAARQYLKNRKAFVDGEVRNWIKRFMNRCVHSHN
jgi:hypothetical protein